MAEAGELRGTIALVERLGDRTLVHVTLTDGTLVIGEDVGKSLLEPGMEVQLSVDGAATHLFDAQGTAFHGN
ncbi:TOBE domain protein [compost metagenome]